jgi:hypothetical protein
MPDADDEIQGIVLFGADGAKYVIPMDVVRDHEVHLPPHLELPDPATADASPDITVIRAYQAPITRHSETAFYFHGGG